MLKALLAAALLSGQAASVPGPARCVTRAEVGDLTLVSAAAAVEVVRNACRSHLPPTAFLATPAGADFSARLRVEGQRRLDSAIDGVARLSGGGANMPRAVIRTFVRGLLSEGAGADFAQHADASLCRDANEMMEIAATLSPDQMARFVGAIASIADHVARMRPMQMPAHIVPLPTAPEGARPSPHPAAFAAPTRQPSPPVAMLMTPPPSESSRPGTATRPARPPHPPLAPFLCQQPE
jgi:hypothetical protein